MKKVILAALALCLVLVFSVNATYAYLSDSASVMNTFTVGQVKISLTEDAVARSAGSSILIPGLTYEKKPVITVDAESQPCWLFIQLENGVESIEAQGNKKITDQLEENGWLPLEDAEDIYYYDGIVSAGESVKTFESFTVSDEITAQQLAACGEAKVGVTAYGIQATGFDSTADAWAQAKIES